MTNAITATTLAAAVDAADAVIAAQAAELDRMKALIASLTAAPAVEAEEVSIVFSQAASAPQAAPTPRATVYEAATKAAAGEAAPALFDGGAREIPQTVQPPKRGGSLHLIGLMAAFAADLQPGDELTGRDMHRYGVKPNGFPNWRDEHSAKTAVSRFVIGGMADRIGAGVGTRGAGYLLNERFFAGAYTVLKWEDGAIVGRRLAVTR